MSAYDPRLYNSGGGGGAGSTSGGAYAPQGGFGRDSAPAFGQGGGTSAINDPRYDPARQAAVRAFGGQPGGRAPMGNPQNSNEPMTSEQLDSLRRLTTASRQETCKHVLYVQRNRETGQLDLPSRFAYMDAVEFDNELAIVDVADIDPQKFPSWLNMTPLLVVRRPDGQYIWKGKRAIQYLEKMNRESTLGMPAAGSGAAQLGSYMPSTYRDPRYDRMDTKIKDASTAVDSFRALREKQDKLHASRARTKTGPGAGARAGQEPPLLPAQDPKTPLSPEALYAMGHHPSQREQHREDFERRRFQALRENPARAMQGGY